MFSGKAPKPRGFLTAERREKRLDALHVGVRVQENGAAADEDSARACEFLHGLHRQLFAACRPFPHARPFFEAGRRPDKFGTLPALRHAGEGAWGEGA